MAAGLPGFGLSGAFFVVSALLMVPIEIVSTLRGRSSLARWGAVLRSAGIALAIIAGLELTYAALHLFLTLLSEPATSAHGSSGQSHGHTAHAVRTIPILPILGTLGLVAIVMVGAKAAEMLSRLRRGPALPVSGPGTEVTAGRVPAVHATAMPGSGRSRAAHGHSRSRSNEHERFAHPLHPQLELATGELAESGPS